MYVILKKVKQPLLRTERPCVIRVQFNFSCKFTQSSEVKLIYNVQIQNYNIAWTPTLRLLIHTIWILSRVFL